MSDSYKELLLGNTEWVESINSEKPDFFETLAKSQSPDYLWIGCADSRVPATQITNTLPGSIFVHRNIANMVNHTDSSMLSVVYYAVKVLKVKHIIVCGHYGCGGVKAALSNEKFGLLDNWLLNIKDVYDIHAEELNSIEDEDKKFDRYVELNVLEQVRNLARISFIQEEWEKGEFPFIHGWVYALHDGFIRDLGFTLNNKESLADIYKYK